MGSSALRSELDVTKLTAFLNIFLGCLARFRELPWRLICLQMSQNYWNTSIWIRRFYSKLRKVWKPSSLNSTSPCSSLSAGLLSLCSQSTFPFQVLSCSRDFVRVSSLLLQMRLRQCAFLPQTWWKLLKSMENLFFHWLCLLFDYLHPICHPSGELDAVPFESPVNVQ